MIKKYLLFLVFVVFSIIPFVYAANCGGDIACDCENRTVNESLILIEDFNCANGLEIVGDNITINCNGKIINGTNVISSEGIYITGRTNITIQNCAIKNFYYGIWSDGNSHVSISRSIFSFNYYGIWSQSSSNLTISDSFVFNNTNDGIDLECNWDPISSAQINNVSIYYNQDAGIAYQDCFLEVNNSRIYNNTGNGIFSTRNIAKLRVTNTNITDNGNDGIYIKQSATDSSYNLTNNYICGNLGLDDTNDSSCPFIYAKSTNEFKFVNDAFPLGKLWFLEEVPWIVKILVKIGILSDVPGIRDTTYTKIPFDLEGTNNQYELRVREQYDERSYFDSIELMVIDHEPGIEIYPDRYSNNIITTSKNLISPISCIDNFGNDCLNLILSLDNNVQKLKKNDYIIVDFGDLSSAEKIKLVLAKGAVGAQNVKKFEVLDKKGNWVESNYNLGNTVNLYGFATTPNVFDMTGLFLTKDYKIKIHAEDLPFLNREFDERLVIDFMAIDTSKQDDNIKITTLKPVLAHMSSSSVNGFWSEVKIFEGNGYNLPEYSSTKELVQYEDVTDKLQNDECNFVNIKNCDKQVVMEFGDEFSAKYDVPILEPGKERDFIVITNGAYEKLLSSGHTDIFVADGYNLIGSGNTCDTTWNYNDSGKVNCANTCSETEITEETPLAEIPATTSSGGSVPIFYPTIINLENEYNKNLGKNWKIKFNVSSEIHTLNLDGVQNQTATITISSTPQTKTLFVGEEWKVELTGDNRYDVYVKLNSVFGNMANVSIKYMSEPVAGSVVQEEEINNQEDSGNLDSQSSQINAKIIIIVFMLLVIIIGVMIFLLYKTKNKRRYTHHRH